MEIKVLGTGCAKCKSLEKVTKKAVEELNLDASVEKVEDIQKIIGPLLFVVGIFMLGIIKLNFPAFKKISQKIQEREKHNYWDAFLLGVVFALAFCPYSGVLYFGMLIPLTINATSGLYLPVVFSIATGIPVIIFAWFIAYSVSGVGKLYNRIKAFESVRL